MTYLSSRQLEIRRCILTASGTLIQHNVKYKQSSWLSLQPSGMKSIACRHILFQVAAGLKALPPPGPGRPEDTSQMGSDNTSAATQLDKVLFGPSPPMELTMMHVISG